MQVLDRFIFFILTLLTLILSLVFISFAIPIYPVVEIIMRNIDYYQQTLEPGIVGLILLLLAIRALWGVFRVKKTEESVSQNTEIGEVKISIQTIESMVTRIAQQEVKGIKEIKPKIRISENGIVIYIKGKVLADLEITQVSEQLQKVVKENIETKAGINVGEVKVFIENITSETTRPSK